MRAPRLAAAFLASVLVAPLARADALDPFALPVETITLSNGLTVLLAPDPHARLASVVVSYGAGSADEPDGLRGLAHMVEHLAEDSSRHTAHAPRRLQAAGGCHFNAVTSLDKTSYFESVPPERLETALWLESDRMGYAADAVTEARVDGERATVANEERDRHLDSALAAVGPFAMREIFPEWHPYAGVEDNDRDLRDIRAKDVLAFLRTWYSPSNATLAIAGAFDRDSTVEAVNRYFGSLPARVASVRREDLVRVANQYLTEPAMHVVFEGDDRWLDVNPLGMGGPTELDLVSK
jgi:zinc protease